MPPNTNTNVRKSGEKKGKSGTLKAPYAVDTSGEGVYQIDWTKYLVALTMLQAWSGAIQWRRFMSDDIHRDLRAVFASAPGLGIVNKIRVSWARLARIYVPE